MKTAKMLAMAVMISAVTAPAAWAQLGQGGSPVPGESISGGVTGGARLKM